MPWTLACYTAMCGANFRLERVHDPILLHKVSSLQEQLNYLYTQAGAPKPTMKPGSHCHGRGCGLWLPGFPTGGGALPYDLELFIRLADTMPHVTSIFGIGNAFGYSTLALALVFPSARIDVLDAEVEGRANAFGTNITRIIATSHNLNVHVHKGLSPWDIHKYVHTPVDIALIDGLHTNSQQNMDFISMFPHMKQSSHVMILHDVQLGKLNDSLAMISEHYGGHVRAYDSVNFCNLYGTTLLTQQHEYPFQRTYRLKMPTL